jgi:hypothetical protein
MGSAREAQLVLGRQLPHLAVDIAVDADAQVMAAVLRPRLGPGIGAAADAHGVTPASSRSNTSMKALWRCWVMRSLIVRASLGT